MSRQNAIRKGRLTVNPAFYPFILLLIILLINRKKNISAVVRMNRKRRKAGKIIMSEIVKSYIGKECIIYSIESSLGAINGIITDVQENWIVLEDRAGKGEKQLLNLEYVTRIQEYPTKKNGKRK